MESINRLHPKIKNTKVIISDFDKPYFERAIKAVGFTDVKVMQHDESTSLIPGVTLDMIRNDKGDDDSSIVLKVMVQQCSVKPTISCQSMKQKGWGENMM